MAAKNFKALAAMLCSVIMIVSSCFVVFAADTNSYQINELDEMTINLPDDMTAITRDSKNTDRYFSVFGLDYENTMNNFKSGDIYLQGMDSDSQTTITVTMTKNSDSRDISNYNLLSSEKLSEVTNNFLLQSEYTACTPDTGKKIVWLYFDTKVASDTGTINAYQANTVYDGMSINVTLQRNSGNVTADDYNTFQNIVSSVNFNKTGSENSMTLPIIIGAAVLALIIIVLLIIMLKKGNNKRKQNKLKRANDRILEELAGKYNTGRDDESDTVDYEISASYDEETYGSTESNDNSDYIFEDDDNVDISSRATNFDSDNYVQDYKLPDLDRVISEDEIDEILGYRKSLEEDKRRQTELSQEESAETDETVFEEDSNGDMQDNQIDEQQDNADGYILEDIDEDEDEIETDEELIRQEAKKNRFEDSDDFFEEAPKKTVGVIRSKEVMDAEDFDVIKEVEEKASKVEHPNVKSEPFGVVFVMIIKKFAGGVKSFFVHCGYFCTNVYKMIKRKSEVKKRRQAELERRERAKRRAERARQQQNSMQNGGLVRVHSRNDRRPTQKRPAQKRPAQKRPAQRRTNNGTNRPRK